MDKVIEKKEQHPGLCKVLAAEGYDVSLLPIVLGSAGTLFKCLDRATNEMDIPNARKREFTASSTFTVYKAMCPNGDTWEDKSQQQKHGEE
jgi:hypothetical protein